MKRTYTLLKCSIARVNRFMHNGCVKVAMDRSEQSRYHLSPPAYSDIFLTRFRFGPRDHPWTTLHPAMLLSRFREQLRSSEWAEKERVPRTAGLAILQAIAHRVDPQVEPDA